MTDSGDRVKPALLFYVFPWRHSVIFPKSFIEIAVVRIPEHGGDLFYGQCAALHQHNGSFHPKTKKDLRKGFSGFFLQKV